MISVQGLQFRYSGHGFSLGLENLLIESGEAVAFVGPSGSGKTTFLYLVAGILRPELGRIQVGDVNVCGLSDAGRRAFRISNIGFVFQQFDLLDYLSVRENILLPYRIHGALHLSRAVGEEAAHLAERVGLGDKLGRFPGALSQGEKQRAAICRALITRPGLILADEPTSSLDRENAAAILDQMFDLLEERGTTLLMLTHDEALLPRFDRVIRLPSFEEDYRP